MTTIASSTLQLIIAGRRVSARKRQRSGADGTPPVPYQRIRLVLARSINSVMSIEDGLHHEHAEMPRLVDRRGRRHDQFLAGAHHIDEGVHERLWSMRT